MRGSITSTGTMGRVVAVALTIEIIMLTITGMGTTMAIITPTLARWGLACYGSPS